MAYMSQDRKAQLSPRIKEVLAKYGMKATISTDRHSISVNIKSGPIDFANSRKKESEFFNHQVNTYWIEDVYTGIACEFLLSLKSAMNMGNWDNSDIQTDYFDVGWYIHINIGKWNKPYTLITKE